MKKEELIKKWLNKDLSKEELQAFEQLEDYNQLQQIDRYIKSIDTPEFDSETEFTKLKSRLHPASRNGMSWLNYVMKIAAVVVLGLSIFYFVVNRDTYITTEIAQQSVIELPDNSIVQINSNSTITFNKWQWDSNREVSLDGEAFFKVAKGEKFDVVTNDGIVSVLGTEFNVKQRNGIFDVTCYEGKVSVKHKAKSVTLNPGDSFTLVDGKQIAMKNKEEKEPSWMHGESTFDSVPLKLVLDELEQHYDVKLQCEDVDSLRLFSGSFPNKNLDVALQSISIALNLKYNKKGNTIIFIGE